MKSNQTAILIFSRSASQEAVTKTFSSKTGRKGNQRIAELLIQKSINTANQTGLPVFTSFCKNQKGETFGERLGNAIENVFKKGFQKLIAIGNDCPSLTSEHLLNAHFLLEKNSIVFGSSNDGGIYLLGIQKKSYCRKSFLELAWETNCLAKNLENFLHQKGLSFVQLSSLNDIDFEIDFYKYLYSKFCTSSFRKKINNILTGHPSIFIFQKEVFPFQFYSNQTRLRAPPF